MPRKISSFILVSLLFFSISSVEATVTITDPVGDLRFSFGQGYQDLTEYSIDLQGDTYIFELVLAEPLPSPLPVLPQTVPPFIKQLRWGVSINTDPDLVIRGYPFARGIAGPMEYFAFLRWDGESLFAELINRLPLLDGLPAEITPINYEINSSRDTIQLMVDANLIGNPSQFICGAAAAGDAGRQGSMGNFLVDFAHGAVVSP